MDLGIAEATSYSQGDIVMALKKTALADVHEEMGGSMVDFFGFYLPTHYTSITDE